MEERVSHVAGRAHRPWRRICASTAGKPWLTKDLRPSQRLAELDLPAGPTRWASAGRSRAVRLRGPRPSIRLEPRVYAANLAARSRTPGHRGPLSSRSTTTRRFPTTSISAEDRGLRRALEHWQPELPQLVVRDGPRGRLPGLRDVYLRTATSAWTPRAGRPVRLRQDARLPLGDLPQSRPGAGPHGSAFRRPHFGEPAWQEVPGEYRANLRRIIVTQGDTEPASVEQQRHARPIPVPVAL